MHYVTDPASTHIIAETFLSYTYRSIFVQMELEEQKKYFHGTLEITIFDATPFSPTFPFNVRIMLLKMKITFC